MLECLSYTFGQKAAEKRQILYLAPAQIGLHGGDMDPWEMVPLGMVVSKESNWGVPPKHQCKHLTVTMQKPPEQSQSL